MTKQLSTEDITAAFEGLTRGTPRSTTCRIGDIVAEQPALKDPIMDVTRYSAPTVSAVLKSLGFPPVSSTLIRNHRRGECRCPKETP